MSGDRSNRRRDNQPNVVLQDGKAIVPPSKRFLKWVKSETGARTLFRPSKEPVHVKKPGRNSPCPCGSGKKYKRCCLRKGA